jgi:hypothetical protein
MEGSGAAAFTASGVEGGGAATFAGGENETDLLHLELLRTANDLLDPRTDGRRPGGLLEERRERFLDVGAPRLDALDLLEHGDRARRRTLGAELLREFQKDGNGVLPAARFDEDIRELHAGARVLGRVLDFALKLDDRLVPLLRCDELLEVLPSGKPAQHDRSLKVSRSPVAHCLLQDRFGRAFSE